MTFVQKVVYIVTKKYFTIQKGHDMIIMSKKGKHLAEICEVLFYCMNIIYFGSVAEFGLMHWS